MKRERGQTTESGWEKWVSCAVKSGEKKAVKGTFQKGDLFDFVYLAIKGDRHERGGFASLVKILFFAKISLKSFHHQFIFIL